MKDDCLFCKIIKKEVPGNIIYEDDDVLVFMDAYPDTDGHLLVVPKKHYEDIYEITPEELTKMFEVGKKVGKEVLAKLQKESLTYLINYGEDQVIKHIHLHILPNFSKKEHKLSKEEIYKILTEE